MKEWINRCNTTHQHTPPIRDCQPTRLIKLLNDEDSGAQLYSPNTPVKFAALSYRWGYGKQSETTKANVFARFKKLKTSDFPKTLQDAIHITRRLGLEYIWIDRICIVQDDKEDWAKEASLMADIYANAYVVLSATATEDCEDGFLQTKVKPLIFQYKQGDLALCEMRARKVESHECNRLRPKYAYTLFGRGWCMQERFLARRIIHFLPDELLFECQAGRVCECGDAREENVDYNDRTGFNDFATLQAASSMEEITFSAKWMSIVRDYSNMELTYGTDSLPALSGVAASIEHLKPGKYIAGLWEHDIALQLGWRHDREPSIIRWTYPENAHILGPTFSWSSHVRSVLSDTPVHAQAICELESFHVKLATTNPYGQVRHASICLRGFVVLGDDMESCFHTPGAYARLDSGFIFSHVPGRNDLAFADFLLLRNGISLETVICLGLCEYSRDDLTYMVEALLLQPKEDGTGEYVRIGLIRDLDEAWFDKNAVESTVTIV
jgi:hypothetical protein